MRKIIFVLAALLWTLAAATVVSAQTQNYGSSMDTFQNALEYNPTNQGSTWVNPDTGGSGTVTPVRTFAGGQGEPCREFQQTIVIGGREEQGYGTACRQPDGSWQIVSGQSAAPSTTVQQQSTVYVREVPTRYYSTYYTPYATPYYPYGYYDPWGYAYPYWYPFNLSLSLGYFYSDGKYYRGHSHGGHYYKGYKGGHYYKGYKGGHSYKGYKGGHSYKGGHGGGGSYKGGYKGGGHRR